MGLKNHEPILKIIRQAKDYTKAFKDVFGKTGEAITMKEVPLAIAAFEPTLIPGNPPFDRFYYAKEKNALTEARQRGSEFS